MPNNRKLPPEARKRNMMGFYANDDLAAAITATAKAEKLPIAEWLRRAADKEIARCTASQRKDLSK